MEDFSLSLVVATDTSLQRTTPNLWDRALQTLDDVGQQRLAPNRADQPVVLDDLLKVVAEKQRVSVERQWKYTKRNGEVVLIRDMFQKVVDWVKKFREVGDAFAQYDPAHLSLPWAGIRILLQLAINDGETYGAMLEGIELVSRYIAKYAKVEELYIHQALAQQEPLEKSITDLYAAILTYLARATQYYDEGRAGRMARNVVRGASSVDKYTKLVVMKASQVDEVAHIIDADFMRKMVRFMHGGFQGVHDRFDDLESRLDGLHLSLGTPFTKPNVGQDQILAWLSPVFTDEEYEAALRLQTPGTCQWMFQRTEFLEWTSLSYTAESPPKTFWVHGPPGFGKTVLCASVVRRLQDDHPHRVAFFFCSSDDAAKRQPLAIVRSWVSQMVLQDPIALEAGENSYRRKDGRPPTTHDVWQLFGEICRQVSNCFLVVDGFDECIKGNQNGKFSSHDEGSRFLRDLSSASTDTSTHILFFSREDPDMRVHFRKLEHSFPLSTVQHEISPFDTELDVQTYTASVVGENLHKKTSELKQEIAEQASRRSQGMFLWIRLLGKRLQGGKNAKQLREIVKRTPAGLEMQYERDVNRIRKLEEDERDRAIAILRWTLFARRPLTVRELTEALAIDLDDDSDRYPEDNLPDSWDEEDVNDEIRRLCGSLVELRGRNESRQAQDHTVHFVHSSVRDYLLRALTGPTEEEALIPSFTLSYEHTLARTCLRYLLCIDFEYQSDGDETNVVEKMDKYRFLEYASRFWYIHAHDFFGWPPELSGDVDRLFDLNAQRWVLWSKVFKVQDVLHGKDRVIPSSYLTPQDAIPLFYMSFLGLTDRLRYHLDRSGVAYIKEAPNTCLHAASAVGCLEVVKLLIARRANMETKDGMEWSPLHFAADRGRLEIARFLVEERADINATAKDGSSSLLLAAQWGHQEVVELLIQRKALINTPNEVGLTALHQAASGGHLKVVRLLVEQQAEVNAATNNFMSPLHYATHNGHLEVVQYLLEQRAEINTVSKGGWSPVHAAAWKGDPELMGLLIKHQANVNAASKEGVTPVFQAVSSGHLDLVQQLIEQHADVNAVSKSGWTSLHQAAQSGHLEIVQCLIKNQAAVNAITQDGYSPLHEAAGNGHLEIVQYLIQQEAAVNALTQDGRSPLLQAAIQGHLKIARLLVKWNGEVNMQSTHGYSPLYAAAQNGHLEVARFLIEKQGMVNTISARRHSPLFQAADNGHLEVVRLLIEQHADANLATTEGWLPIQVAVQNSHLKVVEYLLKHQSNVNMSIKNGWTLLHLAAERGHLEVVRLLIDQQAEINAVAKDGWSSLHIAAEKGHLEVVRLLIDQRAEINAVTKDGWSSLHIAADKGHLEIVRLLIDQRAEINAVTKDEWSSLYIAAQNGHLEVVHLLIDQQAEINAVAKDGWSSLHIAAEKGHLEVVRLLIDQQAKINAVTKDGWSSLHIAAEKGHLEVVRLLIDQQAEINAVAKDGWSSLHIAAEKGHLEVVRLLIDQRAEINAVTKDGWSSLHIAADKGHLEIVRLLIDQRAEINAVTKDEWSSLYIAAQNGHLEVVHLLIDQQAEINAVAKYGWSSLHIAAEKGHLEVVRLLIDQQAEINAVAKDGWSSLHIAAEKGHVEVVRLLIDQRAEINAVTKDGWSSLHFTALNGYLEVVRLLIELQAEVNMVSKENRSALHLASSSGRLEIVKLLLQTSIDCPRKPQVIDTRPEESISYNLQDTSGLTPLLHAMYHGHDEVVLLLANHGADLSRPDLYGRNALNWILANPLLFESFKDTNFPGQPIPPTQQTASLQRTILMIAQKLVRSKMRLERPGFHILGHCFIFLQRISDSIFSFQQHVTGWNEANDPLYAVVCDKCLGWANIVGVRYVCKVCPDVDLCAVCMQKYLDDESMRYCKNHTFLQVAVPAREFTMQPSHLIPDSVQTWLRQLILEFE